MGNQILPRNPPERSTPNPSLQRTCYVGRTYGLPPPQAAELRPLSRRGTTDGGSR